ncbi:LolA-like protein [Actinokineospora pegani]|uniref:hypothetical protein n=1 Tax=Actinokineospora pegani TaxID=2654637 RepID=UPI0012EAB455|nr:hypothetical protein [Actinokineospora pegani]
MGKTRLTVAGALLSALALAGCGSTTPGAPVPTGAPAASEQGSAGGIGSLKALAEAVADNSVDAQGVHVEMTTAGGPLTTEGAGDISFAGEQTSMSFTTTTPVGEMTMVLVDQVFYLKVPPGLGLGGDKPWMKVTADTPGAESFGSTLDQMKNTDPREQLKNILNAGELIDQEKTTLDGQDVTHYTIQVDVAKLDEKSGYDDATKKTLTDAGITEYPMEIWVNGDSLFIRSVTTVPVPGVGESKVQLDYTDWGKPVKVEAPDPAEVSGS